MSAPSPVIDNTPPSPAAAAGSTARIVLLVGDPGRRQRLQDLLRASGHAGDAPDPAGRPPVAGADVVVIDLGLEAAVAAVCSGRGPDARPLVVGLQASPGTPGRPLPPAPPDCPSDTLFDALFDIVDEASPGRLRTVLRNALALAEAAGERDRLLQASSPGAMFEEVVGARGGLRAASRLVDKIAPTDLPVFLHGEPGTGKELLARAIHAASPRRGRPFLVVRCGELPDSLVEAELFGAEPDPATGAPAAVLPGQLELADGGTLFLDEVAALGRGLQARLLRACQDRAALRAANPDPHALDLRIIAAGKTDPVEDLRAGRLREDFYYRVSVFPIRVPPLRERPEDVPALVRHALASDGAAPAIAPGALELLEAYGWPGNVRELQNVLRRASLLAGDGPIRPEHLPGAIQAFGARLAPPPAPPALAPRAAFGTRPPAHAELVALEDVERAHILRVVEGCRGNLSQAARLLDIGRTTLYRKLQRYGVLEGQEFAGADA